MWYLYAQAGMSEADLGTRLKQIIRTTPIFAKMFESYGVDFKDLWKVQFRIKALKGSYAASKGDEIFIDPEVFAKFGLERGLFVVAHELVHWLTRQREKEDYFADPEEVEAFNWSIAFERSKGRDWDYIEQIMLPLIEKQIKDPAKAKQFIVERFKDSQRLCPSTSHS